MFFELKSWILVFLSAVIPLFMYLLQRRRDEAVPPRYAGTLRINLSPISLPETPDAVDSVSRPWMARDLLAGRLGPPFTRKRYAAILKPHDPPSYDWLPEIQRTLRMRDGQSATHDAAPGNAP